MFIYVKNNVIYSHVMNIRIETTYKRYNMHNYKDFLNRSGSECVTCAYI